MNTTSSIEKTILTNFPGDAVGARVWFRIERYEGDKVTAIEAYSTKHKDANNYDLIVGHIQVPDEAIENDSYSIGDIYVDRRYQRNGVASTMTNLMSDYLGCHPTGAQRYFNASVKEWWEKYSGNLGEKTLLKEIESNEKASFMAEQVEGEEFYFGSNNHGYVNEDGTVWFNSHGQELSDFKSRSDFSDWYYDDDNDVEFVYRYRIGQREDDGSITYIDEKMKYDPIDLEEDGSDIWSSPVIKKGDVILHSAVEKPTSAMVVGATNMDISAIREILSECSNDSLVGLNPEGMIDRILSTYSLNIDKIGEDKVVSFLADTYNFSKATITEVVKNFVGTSLLKSNDELHELSTHGIKF